MIIRAQTDEYFEAAEDGVWSDPQPLSKPGPTPLQPMPTVSVIVPTLNEACNLPYVLPAIPDWVHEVILVDGQSDDRTVSLAREIIPNIRIIIERAKGKGAALRAGFAHATGDIIVMLDADASTDPGEIPLFIGALMAGADYVKGSRFLQGGGTADMPFYRKWGNKVFVRAVRLLFGGNFTDLLYGYNAFWRDVLPQLDLEGDGFEIETVMNLHALNAHLKIAEVPSFEAARAHGRGRLQTIPDGWRVLKTIVREALTARERAPKTPLRADPQPLHRVPEECFAEEE